MTPRTFHAMGTDWWIASDRPERLPLAEAFVRDVEARLSRFLEDSALARANREREATDPVLAEVVGLALELGRRTGGAFDPTMGLDLARLGYDRAFTGIGRPAVIGGRRTALAVRVEGDRVRLDGDGHLDLGGIAKGWTVDRVHDRLREGGAGWALVDGGGDLRGSGRDWPVGLGDDGVVTLRGDAVATSSVRVRAWVGADEARRHHVLDPATGLPSAGALTDAVVRAADATTADALATALLAAPERVLPRLAGLGARAMARDDEGRWWSTPDWSES